MVYFLEFKLISIKKRDRKLYWVLILRILSCHRKLLAELAIQIVLAHKLTWKDDRLANQVVQQLRSAQRENFRKVAEWTGTILTHLGRTGALNPAKTWLCPGSVPTECKSSSIGLRAALFAKLTRFWSRLNRYIILSKSKRIVTVARCLNFATTAACSRYF